MKALREIANPDGKRVETGAIQFEGDWPGVFIRGDNALAIAGNLRGYLAHPENPHWRRLAENLLELLESCHARNFYGAVRQEGSHTGNE